MSEQFIYESPVGKLEIRCDENDLLGVKFVETAYTTQNNNSLLASS